MKKCTKCKETKSLEQFGKNASRIDGRNSHCNACVKRNTIKRMEEIKLRKQFEII